jgi:hypothetical protein
MAFPIAKTIAVKDAADHIGKLFGADLNRKETLDYKPDSDLAARFGSNKEKLNHD